MIQSKSVFFGMTFSMITHSSLKVNTWTKTFCVFLFSTRKCNVKKETGAALMSKTMSKENAEMCVFCVVENQCDQEKVATCL